MGVGLFERGAALEVVIGFDERRLFEAVEPAGCRGPRGSAEFGGGEGRSAAVKEHRRRTEHDRLEPRGGRAPGIKYHASGQGRIDDQADGSTHVAFFNLPALVWALRRLFNLNFSMAIDGLSDRDRPG